MIYSTAQVYEKINFFQENLLRTYKGQIFTKNNFQAKNLMFFLIANEFLKQ